MEGVYMQTISVEVKDEYIQSFIDYVESHNENIMIANNENLDYDPYFHERQKELQKIRDEIKNNSIDMVSHNEIWGNIKKHLKENNQ